MLTMETNTYESIVCMLILRKMLLELKAIAPYQMHLQHVNSLINAVVSGNINMINTEVTRIEKVYEPDIFKVHPIEYFQMAKQVNERCLDIIRSMGYYFTSDAHAIEDITKLLLITDRDKYTAAVNYVYGSEVPIL